MHFQKEAQLALKHKAITEILIIRNPFDLNISAGPFNFELTRFYYSDMNRIFVIFAEHKLLITKVSLSK